MRSILPDSLSNSLSNSKPEPDSRPRFGIGHVALGASDVAAKTGSPGQARRVNRGADP